MMQPWWERFFDETYAPLLCQRSETELREVAATIIREADLSPGQRVFEQCCGLGHVAAALGKYGLTVEGIDLNTGYIAYANAHHASHDVVFRQADAYRHVPSTPCHAVINWYTSFGYGTDAQSLAMMQCAGEALLAEGTYLIETVNPDYVLANFTPHQQHDYPTKEGILRVEKQCRLDHEQGLFISEWQFHRPDGTTERKYGESRIYGPDDYRRLLSMAGFVRIDAAAAGNHGTRLLIRAQKGAA